MNTTLVVLGLVALYLSDFVTGFIRNINIKLELRELKKRSKDTTKKKRIGPFKSIDELLIHLDNKRSKLEKFIRKFSVLVWIRSNLWYRLLDHPRDLHLWIKTKYQRAQKGWAVSDTWGFDYYLAKVIKEGVTHLKKNKTGFPTTMFTFKKMKEPTDKESKIVEKKWESILNKIIYSFEIAYKITNCERAQYMPKLSINKRKELKCLTNKEYKDMREGMNLFIKHFFELWD